MVVLIFRWEIFSIFVLYLFFIVFKGFYLKNYDYGINGKIIMFYLLCIIVVFYYLLWYFICEILLNFTVFVYYIKIKLWDLGIVSFW